MNTVRHINLAMTLATCEETGLNTDLAIGRHLAIATCEEMAIGRHLAIWPFSHQSCENTGLAVTLATCGTGLDINSAIRLSSHLPGHLYGYLAHKTGRSGHNLPSQLPVCLPVINRPTQILLDPNTTKPCSTHGIFQISEDYITHWKARRASLDPRSARRTPPGLPNIINTISTIWIETPTIRIKPPQIRRILLIVLHIQDGNTALHTLS